MERVKVGDDLLDRWMLDEEIPDGVPLGDPADEPRGGCSRGVEGERNTRPDPLDDPRGLVVEVPVRGTHAEEAEGVATAEAS